MLAAHLDEGFVGALHDALRADVDPRAGRHLAVHHQALLIELVEVFPRRPVRDEVGVGEQHARRVGVRGEDADRLAGLDQQGFVVAEGLAAIRGWRRSIPSRARRGRCRRRRRARRGSRRRRDRGCSGSSGTGLRSARTCRTAECRAARGWCGWGLCGWTCAGPDAGWVDYRIGGFGGLAGATRAFRRSGVSRELFPCVETLMAVESSRLTPLLRRARHRGFGLHADQRQWSRTIAPVSVSVPAPNKECLP